MQDLELSEEQALILVSVAKLCADVAAPNALHQDEHREFVRASFDALGELGLFGVLVSEASGGAGLGHVALVVAVEECARACGSTARVLGTQGGVCAAALDGLPAGAELLERVLTGAAVAAFVGPEHGLGARAEGASILVDGTAPIVTGAGSADVVLVAARLAAEPLLLAVDAAALERSDCGALGFRAAAPAAIRCRASAAYVVARGQEATAALARAELAGLLCSAALACGSARGAIEHTQRHAAQRIAFGKPLLAQQAVAHKLVECKRRTAAARHLTFHAASLAAAQLVTARSATGESDARAAAQLARLTAVDAAVLAGDEGIQIHGGYGYTVEYHVERHYRDAVALSALDGGADRLRDALARP